MYDCTPAYWMLICLCYLLSIRGLYYENMMIINNDHKWCHKLEHHSRVVDYALRVISYAPREHFWCMCHSWWSTYNNHKIFIVKATGLLCPLFWGFVTTIDIYKCMIVLQLTECWYVYATCCPSVACTMKIWWSLMMITNDATSWSVTLELSITLLKSSVLLLENIYITGVTHNDYYMFVILATGFVMSYLLGPI